MKKAKFRAIPAIVASWIAVACIVTAALLILKGCNDDDEDENAQGQIEVEFQYQKMEQDLQNAGILMSLNSITYEPGAGNNKADIINYLIANSYAVDRDLNGVISAIKISVQPPNVLTALTSQITALVGSKTVLPYRVEWSYQSQTITAIVLIDEATKQIIYDPVASNLTTRRPEMIGALTRLSGTKDATQPSHPGDMINIWSENIFVMDLFAVAISWGTAYCDENGCIVVPANPNMFIQVGVESSLGWTADAVVSGFQVSPDCKSVTFQITIVAAGPFATMEIEYNNEGVKIGANVSGPVGTYKRTINATWRCP